MASVLPRPSPWLSTQPHLWPLCVHCSKGRSLSLLCHCQPRLRGWGRHGSWVDGTGRPGQDRSTGPPSHSAQPVQMEPVAMLLSVSSTATTRRSVQGTERVSRYPHCQELLGAGCGHLAPQRLPACPHAPGRTVVPAARPQGRMLPASAAGSISLSGPWPCCAQLRVPAASCGRGSTRAAPRAILKDSHLTQLVCVTTVHQSDCCAWCASETGP